jgi:hypothetical protein
MDNKTQEIKNLIKDPENWPKFLKFYYFKTPQLEIRTISGSKPVNFKYTELDNKSTVVISDEQMSQTYEFLFNDEIIDLNTHYKGSLMAIRTLKIMGINITPSKEAILDNILHLVEFGHVH